MTYQMVVNGCKWANRLDNMGQRPRFVPCTEQMGETPGPICTAGIAKMLL